MKRIVFFFSISIVILTTCSEPKKSPASYMEISNKSQIDSITKEYVDREAYPFIYTRLEDSNGNVIYENSFKNERLLADYNICLLYTSDAADD